MMSELRHLITTYSILERRDKRTLILITLAQSFLSLLDLVGIALLGIIGSLVVSGVSIREPSGVPAQILQMFGIEEQRIQIQTAVLGTIAVIALIGKSLLSLWFSRKAILFLARLSAQLSNRLTSSLLGNDLQSRGMQDAHGSVYAVTAGVGALTTGLLGSAISMIADLSVLFAMFITVSIVDSNLAIISLTMFSCVGVVLNRLLSRKARVLGIRQSELSVNINRSLLDVISAFREFFVRGTLGIRLQEIGRLQTELARNQATLSFMPSIGKYLLEVLMIFGVFVIAGYQFLSKSSEDAVAAITIFLAASSRLGPAVLRIQYSLVQIRNSTALAGQTLRLIDELPGQQDDFFETDRIGLQPKEFEPEIEVSDLHLTYKNSGTKAVKGVSVKVSSGEMLAIVGKSGSGKTSFVDAILGLIYPDSGTIQISGMSSRKAIEAWSGKIAYVPQVPTLSNASIRENILLGLDKNSFDDDSIWNALDLAGLKSEISRLDEQLDFVVGDAGSRLSGGQRQRLGIARALLTKPKLLVLDEATSALDSLTERNLSESLRGLRGEVTLIVIAHRLSTIRDADLIMYLEGGESKFQGTFEEARKYIDDFEKQIKLQTF